MSTRTPDRLQQFKAHIAFKLASCKEHIPTLTRTMRFDAPREAAALYQERSALVAQAVELQAVLDYLRDFEAELAYDARTAQMLGG
ncbi:hypothetical protein [Comamonas kerstersii]|uniref:hypothetical protein n=1 Tax=Comamonas kerstersii TaxID=225992 RepID=UPI00345CFA08